MGPAFRKAQHGHLRGCSGLGIFLTSHGSYRHRNQTRWPGTGNFSAEPKGIQRRGICHIQISNYDGPGEWTSRCTATRDDARVTPIGRLLRSESIDELPQIVNVSRSEMSLIGPRPHALSHDNYFESILSDYAFRRHVKPGITGWAQ